MYFRQTSCLVDILRRPRDVVLTVISCLRASWKNYWMRGGVTVTNTAGQSSGIEKKLESEVLYVSSVVSKILEDSFPGRQVSVQARLEGSPQAAFSFLEKQILKTGKDN